MEDRFRRGHDWGESQPTAWSLVSELLRLGLAGAFAALSPQDQALNAPVAVPSIGHG